MKFSLILATRNRTAEVRRLLDSLERQNPRDFAFELIVADNKRTAPSTKVWAQGRKPRGDPERRPIT